MLFLIYPGVSSTILRLYICKNIDGQDYLLTDLRIRCGTSTWNLFTVASVPLILIYPIGIPVFFFVLLRTNRHMLRDKRIEAQLGFLYAGYTGQCWWFELVDTAHKLFVTSILAFFPSVAQLALGMSAVTLYTMALLYLNPYLRCSDDLFHVLCQCEILLIILVGYVFQSKASGYAYSSSDDISISFALITITLFVFVGFLYQVLVIGGSWIQIAWEKRQARRAKLQAKLDAKLAKQLPLSLGQRVAPLELADEAGLAKPKSARQTPKHAAADSGDDKRDDSASSSSESGSGSGSAASGSGSVDDSRSGGGSGGGGGDSGSGSASGSGSEDEDSPPVPAAATAAFARPASKLSHLPALSPFSSPGSAHASRLPPLSGAKRLPPV